jgi:NUMOD4 motif
LPPLPEAWLPVPCWPSYEVSDRGRVRSVPRVLSDGRRHGWTVLRQRTTRKGYKTVTLAEPGRRRTFRVHVIEMLAFAGPPPPGKPQVRHLDGNPAHNWWPSNLAYGDQADQEADKASARARQGSVTRRRGVTERTRSELRRRKTRSEIAIGYRGLATVAGTDSRVPQVSVRPGEIPVFSQDATGRATGAATGRVTGSRGLSVGTGSDKSALARLVLAQRPHGGGHA